MSASKKAYTWATEEEEEEEATGPPVTPSSKHPQFPPPCSSTSPRSPSPSSLFNRALNEDHHLHQTRVKPPITPKPRLSSKQQKLGHSSEPPVQSENPVLLLDSPPLIRKLVAPTEPPPPPVAERRTPPESPLPFLRKQLPNTESQTSMSKEHPDLPDSLAAPTLKLVTPPDFPVVAWIREESESPDSTPPMTELPPTPPQIQGQLEDLPEEQTSVPNSSQEVKPVS